MCIGADDYTLSPLIINGIGEDTERTELASGMICIETLNRISVISCDSLLVDILSGESVGAMSEVAQIRKCEVTLRESYEQIPRPVLQLTAELNEVDESPERPIRELQFVADASMGV
jgi:hypothetical protein